MLGALAAAVREGTAVLERIHATGLSRLDVSTRLSMLTQVGRTTALTVLGALAAADREGTAVLGRIHATGLPGRLLQELADALPSDVLSQVRLCTCCTLFRAYGVACFLMVRLPLGLPPCQSVAPFTPIQQPEQMQRVFTRFAAARLQWTRGSRSSLPMVEASLRLLLRLAAPAAGGAASAAPAHRLFVLNAIPRLAQVGRTAPLAADPKSDDARCNGDQKRRPVRRIGAHGIGLCK